MKFENFNLLNDNCLIKEYVEEVEKCKIIKIDIFIKYFYVSFNLLDL